MNEKMNHFDTAGNAFMVDVGEKFLTERVAVASGKIFVGEKFLTANSLKIGVARFVEIIAAKKTSDVIPLCHPLPLNHCSIPSRRISRQSFATVNPA